MGSGNKHEAPQRIQEEELLMSQEIQELGEALVAGQGPCL